MKLTTRLRPDKHFQCGGCNQIRKLNCIWRYAVGMFDQCAPRSLKVVFRFAAAPRWTFVLMNFKYLLSVKYLQYRLLNTSEWEKLVKQTNVLMYGLTFKSKIIPWFDSLAIFWSYEWVLERFFLDLHLRSVKSLFVLMNFKHLLTAKYLQ